MPPIIHIPTHEFHPFTGGIGTYVEETARAAAAAGLNTTVWAPGSPGDDPERFPFRVNRIRMRGKQDWFCRLRMAAALKKAFPEGRVPGTLVLAEPGPIRLWMYASIAGLPKPDRLVIVLHGSEIAMLGRNSRRRARLQRLLEAADCVGCVSGPVRQMVLDLAPGAAGRIVMVPGAVRSAWRDLPPVPRRKRDVAEILHVGRIHPRKGQLELVEAAGRLPEALRRTIRVRLIGPVGRPRYLARIRERADALSVPLQLDGRLPEPGLQAAYEAAAVVALPSQVHGDSVEGLGLSLLEAQHFGCPVIGTRIGGIPEALLEGESGLLVPPGDAEALALALARLLEDPDAAATMGNNGARFVREAFSWQNNLRQLGLA